MESSWTFFLLARWNVSIPWKIFSILVESDRPKTVSRNNSCHEVLSFLSVPIEGLQGQTHSEHFFVPQLTGRAQTLRNFNCSCMMLYTVPCEQPTACATSLMNTCQSLWIICSTCCTVASVDTSAGWPGHSQSLMFCLPLLNSWIQLNTVFHEKQLSPYTGCISWCISSADSPLGYKKHSTECCSARVHSCNTPAIVLWLPLTDHVPKWLDTTFTTSIHILPSADKLWTHNVQMIIGKWTFATYILNHPHINIEWYQGISLE